MKSHHRRISKLEKTSTGSDADIPISTWIKTIEQQQGTCSQENVKIAPIQWEATNE